MRAGDDLEDAFAWKEERTLSKTLTLQYPLRTAGSIRLGSLKIKESKWLWEPFLYDHRPLKGATTDASPVQNLVRIHLEVVEVLERMVPEYSQ